MEPLIEGFVEMWRAETGRRDGLLSMSLTAADGESMPERLVRDEMMTVLFAGHETTATALTFTWYLLARNPVVERRLRAELNDLDTDRPTFDALDSPTSRSAAVLAGVSETSSRSSRAH